MKRKLLNVSFALSLSSLLVASACTLEEDLPNGTGGTSSNGTGGTTGGSTATPGVAGSNPTGTAGTTSTGGMSSTAGTTSTGGMVGTAGTTSTGGTGGTAGSATGGVPPTTGGTGTGGTGGSAPVDLVNDVTGKVNANGFALKDSWFLIPCINKLNHDCFPNQTGDCPNTGDPVLFNRGVKFEEDFAIGGEMGKTYTVTITVNGIVEAKYYRNGMRRAGTSNDGENSVTGQDTWYVGGEPTVTNYNTYMIRVMKPDGMELEHYMLNSFDANSGNEAHETFSIGYEASFDVIGGGTIKYFNHDGNCRAINNCGIGDHSTECPDARPIPNEPGLMLPKMYGGKTTASMNPYTGDMQPFHAQAIHIKVKSVVAKP